jgi:hypothetical protein
MTPARSILSIGIDGLWTAMDFARLMHIVVRFYRLEQLIVVSQAGGARFFEDRLDAVVLKHLAAFDWIAAPLMSAKFNQSYVRSEDLVRDFALDDPRIAGIDYDPHAGLHGDGHGNGLGAIAFSGIGPVIDRIHAAITDVLEIHRPGSGIAKDAQGKFAALEAMYAANMRAKAELMRAMHYSDAELHAIVSPSIEDLHFISNAMTQGRIVTVEKRTLVR